MREITLTPTWDGFRTVARKLLASGVSPGGMSWREAGEASAHQLGLLEAPHQRECEPATAEPVDAPGARVPRAFLALGETVACHREPPSWPTLYRVLWRLLHGEKELLNDPADADMVVLGGMERAIRRDSHKMKAFVRFRSVIDPDGERFVAWFEPKHRIVRRTAPFFERRFPSMCWSILTPDECVHWDGDRLTYTPGVSRDAAPAVDALEEAWLTYYTHTFNPARVRVQAMRAEMPVYYWRNMPEAVAIAGLLREAPARVRKMIAQGGQPREAAAAPSEYEVVRTRVTGPDQSDARRTSTYPFADGEGISEASKIGSPESKSPDATTVGGGAFSLRETSGTGAESASRSRGPARSEVGEAGMLLTLSELGSSSSGAPGARSASPFNELPSDLSPLRIPKIRIGVAGWDYPDWAGRVYPKGREGVDRLRWVASRFDLIEVNSTFYRPASRRAATSWLERTSDKPHLRFAAKLVRGFTHERGTWRLSDVAAVREGMLPILQAGKLTSLLVQFPWSFKMGYDERRHLKRILDAFADFPLHVEVRHTSWDHAGFRNYLTDRGVGLVNIDQPIFDHSIEPAAEVTSPIAYLRLHGRNEGAWFRSDATRDERYDYSYAREELAPWAERARVLSVRTDVEEVEVVFNNHYRGQAVDNAEEFGRLLKGMTSEPGAPANPALP